MCVNNTKKIQYDLKIKSCLENVKRNIHRKFQVPLSYSYV